MAYQHTMHPNVARGGWSRLPANDRRFEVVDMVHQVEQAPDPNNRVTLGEQRDELGMPLARVSSQWSEVDLNSLRRNRRLLAEQLERAGIGRVIDPTADGPPSLHQLGGMHHHMGTTRMHVDPARGVVDSNLRVHGVDNLFVAGSSVFPTAGYANPTLTLLALSIRLADHLRGRTLGAPAAAAFEHVG
jgi:choline dehydrogenase-like flavoprotein